MAEARKRSGSKKELFSDLYLTRTQVQNLVGTYRMMVVSVEFPGCNMMRLVLSDGGNGKDTVIDIESICEAGVQSMRFTKG